MAQKIAPAALRLYTNKKFDASWFSDRMYGSLLQQTLNIKKFVHSIFESIGTKTALSHVQATPQHIYIQSFFCSPRVMNQRLRKKYVSLESNTQFLHPFEVKNHNNYICSFVIYTFKNMNVKGINNSKDRQISFHVT